VLPVPILIADKLNNRLIVVDPQGRIRWQFPRRGDLRPGQTFRVPDDAFFTPDGKYIVATQEDQAVITLIDVATRRIVYRYGVPGDPGAGRNHLDNPDDGMQLPDHYILTADIKNCRLLLIAPGAHRPARVIGRTTQACRHNPPRRWGSPNGVFPETNGRYLVTEINGDWVDEIDLHGHVYWSVHPPGVLYPSDTNQVGPDRFLTADYSSPGQVVIFNRAGRRIWRFRGSGRNTLDHPSLALPLPNGDVVLNDDYNHRVIVIDPRTNRIRWQYGVTGHAGARVGYLDNPDGIDLVPPDSLLARGR
jgi:DNA-binding beta-propeller fold protein YncE